MPSRDDIVNAARKWKGTRWRHQGRSQDGIDCVGLIVMVARELGLSDYDFAGYQKRPTGRFLSHFESNLDRCPLKVGKPGDIAVFTQAGQECHTGIIGQKHGMMTIIHATARHRQVVEEYLVHNDTLQKELSHSFSFRGVD